MIQKCCKEVSFYESKVELKLNAIHMIVQCTI